MTWLHVPDTISGKEGRAYATINGQVEELFYAKSVEAKAEKMKAEVKVLGRRAVGHKTVGWKGTGSMTIHYITPKFRQMMLDYIKTGRDQYFDLQIINEDPGSTAGKQTTVLKHVNLDNTIMAKFDTESDVLDESVDFTFEDVDMLDQFRAPVNG